MGRKVPLSVSVCLSLSYTHTMDSLIPEQPLTSKAPNPWDSPKPSNSQSSSSEPAGSAQACGESCVLNPHWWDPCCLSVEG